MMIIIHFMMMMIKRCLLFEILRHIRLVTRRSDTHETDRSEEPLGIKLVSMKKTLHTCVLFCL
jgi:hypothetical protein